MALDHRRDKLSLFVGRQSGKPDQQDATVREVLPEHQFAEVLVGCHEDRIFLSAAGEHNLVAHARLGLGDGHNAMAFGAQPIDYLLVDALIRDESHPASFSRG